MTFWSRSRNELWEKGATSGNVLNLVSIPKNCEANSFLVKARPVGPTCHTNNPSCYYREFDPETHESSPRLTNHRATEHPVVAALTPNVLVRAQRSLERKAELRQHAGRSIVPPSRSLQSV